MKILILPDVHNKWKLAEKIIFEIPHHKVLFLGDYFDDFGDSEDTVRQVAKWLLKSVNQEDRIHLLGNHDTGYLFSNRRLICSGYTESKDEAISEIIRGTNLTDKVKWFHFEDGWLFTHAGLARYFIPNLEPENVPDYLEKQSILAFEKAKHSSDNHWFFQCGAGRYGNYPCGGITWCDVDEEFSPLKGLKQCFGHTPHSAPIWTNEENLCLDTHLRHYAILEDGNLETFEVPLNWKFDDLPNII